MSPFFTPSSVFPGLVINSVKHRHDTTFDAPFSLPEKLAFGAKGAGRGEGGVVQADCPPAPKESLSVRNQGMTKDDMLMFGGIYT